MMALKLRHEGAEMMTIEVSLKQNYHSENQKSEIDSESNIGVLKIDSDLQRTRAEEINCIQLAIKLNYPCSLTCILMIL